MASAGSLLGFLAFFKFFQVFGFFLVGFGSGFPVPILVGSISEPTVQAPSRWPRGLAGPRATFITRKPLDHFGAIDPLDSDDANEGNTRCECCGGCLGGVLRPKAARKATSDTVRFWLDCGFTLIFPILLFRAKYHLRDVC